jgi:uncharacterized protein YxeA
MKKIIIIITLIILVPITLLYIDGVKSKKEFMDTWNNIDIDFTKVSKDTMEKYGILDYSFRSYDEVKEEMNASGSMTCK